MIIKKRTEERIGEILLRQKVITQKQLQQALDLQKKEGGLLGEILIKLELVSEKEIAQAIISQYGFPFMPVEHTSLCSASD